jgi:hypothetical protein
MDCWKFSTSRTQARLACKQQIKIYHGVLQNNVSKHRPMPCCSSHLPFGVVIVKELDGEFTEKGNDRQRLGQEQ